MSERSPWWRSTRARSVVAAVALASMLVLFGLESATLWVLNPPVWPDEALFASPARELLHTGRMRAAVFEGLWPSAAERAYYVPPLYPWLLSGVFGVFGEGLNVMRGLSLACGAGVLALSYSLARRLGTPWVLAALVPGLLALDPVFGRGARLGRMDMLGLLLVLAALRVRLVVESRAGAASWGAGALAGLALCVHPITAVVVAIVLGQPLLRGDRRALGLTLAGLALGVVPWAAWVLQDPAAFADQWAAQLTRKAQTWEDYGPWPWLEALRFNLSQYRGDARLLVRVALPVAWACLALSRDAAARWTLGLGLLLALAVLRGAEMWYPLYCTPFLPLGLSVGVGAWRQPSKMLAARGEHERPERAATGDVRPARGATVIDRYRRPLAALALVLGCLWCAVALRRALPAVGEAPSGPAYAAWSAKLVTIFPPGSQVLLAAIPDPYFATLARPDLKVREFLPGGTEPGAQVSERFLDETDFVVVGRFVPTPWVARALETRGRLVAELGKPSDRHFARVFVLRP